MQAEDGREDRGAVCRDAREVGQLAKACADRCASGRCRMECDESGATWYDECLVEPG